MGAKILNPLFSDKDGRVYCLDTNLDTITKPPPKYVASEKGFNDFVLDGEAVSFEDKLQKIETRAAPVIKKISTSRTLVGIGIKDRRRVAEFLAAQSFRTKAFYEGLSGKPNREQFGQIFQLLWESARIIAYELARRHWALMVVEDANFFYLGDNPLVLQRTEDPKDGSNLGFDVLGVEAFLPLTPHCALYMPCRSTSDDLIARYDAAIRLHRTVRAVTMMGLGGGSAELQMAQEVIRKLHSLVQAFRVGEPIIATQENVENLNYLQCSWAYRAVYSKDRNFEFAKRVFQENPQYRTVPRTSLFGWGEQ